MLEALKGHHEVVSVAGGLGSSYVPQKVLSASEL